MENIIYIKDFTEYPGLRHCSISDDSGEEYYHSILNQAFKNSYEKKQKLVINIDFTAGYAPSFLDEAFGNLIYDFGIETVQKFLEIVSEQEPDLKEMIISETFPQWEQRRNNNDEPKKTKNHQKWFRLEEGEITTKSY
ncbi:STAS-like domain-containing protein [Sinomicrobium weinanense]|uniref:STAS-like domain-containing protein n=1 Tax=Sinomicrobium weinanense TaxID=2842200 RepID=A0A926Q4A5_9FLAO|nr:STAS-like domain-containing protein [Sinomicrobium weinanense]MBC9798413.1 STAS-like domain-containing protein [Sinomicrobium weinanense]MBU3125993.1 STAS-like domain-containing protein [Sinomicrobium weinanense]